MMAHGAELLFTVSGKGNSEQEKQYNYPTSIALSYDPAYGAMMADSAPDEVLNDPNHPLYYHYITPVVFVADSGAHCIRKIHSTMMEVTQQQHAQHTMQGESWQRTYCAHYPLLCFSVFLRPRWL